MAEELEKTCKNCKYDDEDMEGTHCRHCIHNATEKFEPKEVELSEQEIRNKAIDEFAEKIKKKGIEDSWNCNDFYGDSCGVVSCEECENDFLREIDEIAEQMKAGGKNEID